MYNEIITVGAKSAGLAAIGIAGTLVAQISPVDKEQIFGVSVSAIKELGSFGLIILFVLGTLWLLKKGIEIVVPKFILFLEATTTKFLDELKSMREQHAADMKEERAAREKTLSDFREMLAAHKNDLGQKLVDVKGSIDKGNELTENLVEGLSGRPCQIAKPK